MTNENYQLSCPPLVLLLNDLYATPCHERLRYPATSDDRQDRLDSPLCIVDFDGLKPLTSEPRTSRPRYFLTDVLNAGQPSDIIARGFPTTRIPELVPRPQEDLSWDTPLSLRYIDISFERQSSRAI